MVRRLIIFLLLFSTTLVYSQRKVSCTGHITAEIIEGVAITSNMARGIQLDDQSVTVSLGEISLASDQDIACNVILNSGDLESAAGVVDTFQPSYSSYGNSSYEDADNKKILRFSASAKNLREQKNGIYKGSYSVMLMYE